MTFKLTIIIKRWRHAALIVDCNSSVSIAMGFAIVPTVKNAISTFDDSWVVARSQREQDD
jgi:hypothetical protein